MRIISRSLHTRMNKQKIDLSAYQEQVKALLNELQTYQEGWKPERFFPPIDATPKKLIIIIGAQKGLCGNYNTEIEYIVHNQKAELQNSAIITVGKRTADLVKDAGFTITKQLDELKSSSVDALTESITQEIMTAQPLYTQVTMISSQPESFFVHKLQKLALIPFEYTATQEPESYLWQNNANTVLDKIAQMYLQTIIYNTLFMSLLGEQSARFVAMDNATRNADNFIDAMELQYNKLRQAKITRELTELSANFKV